MKEIDFKLVDEINYYLCYNLKNEIMDKLRNDLWVKYNSELIDQLFAELYIELKKLNYN